MEPEREASEISSWLAVSPGSQGAPGSNSRSADGEIRPSVGCRALRIEASFINFSQAMAEYRALPPALTLPDSVWVDILSRLNGQDLARAMCTCRTFAGLQHPVFQASCLKRFPNWTPYLESDCHWRRQYELLCLRDLAERTTPDVTVWRQTQRIITERHRAILVEWICEVTKLGEPFVQGRAILHDRLRQVLKTPSTAQIALDWNVESAISCKAVSYLDQWLCKYAVDRLDRFQLIGIACLRTALGDMRRPTALVTDKHMDATTFASLSDNSYSEDDVEAMTKVRIISPLAKHGFRRLPLIEGSLDAAGGHGHDR